MVSRINCMGSHAACPKCGAWKATAITTALGSPLDCALRVLSGTSRGHVDQRASSDDRSLSAAGYHIARKLRRRIGVGSSCIWNRSRKTQRWHLCAEDWILFAWRPRAGSTRMLGLRDNGQATASGAVRRGLRLERGRCAVGLCTRTRTWIMPWTCLAVTQRTASSSCSKAVSGP